MLAEMEEQLEECDAEPHPSDTRRFDQNERRRVLMDKIHDALVQYGSSEYSISRTDH